jgi:phosphate starvation-inducible protein PhoH
MIICGDDAQVDLRKRSDSGFKFLYKGASKIKKLKAITLKTNHRDPIVEDLLKYYDESLISI